MAGINSLMRIYLIRHGQTEWNIAGRAQGHTDIPLDPTGLEQAAALGQSFADLSVDRIYSSDLERAHETAKAISAATGVPIEPRTELRERGFGEWEGSNFHEVTTRMESIGREQNLSIVEVRPPGGESFHDVWNRTERFKNEVETSDDNIVIVGHGGSCSILLAQFLRGSVETSRSLRFGNTGVSELSRRPDGLFNLERYNDTRHAEMARRLGNPSS